MRYNRASLSAAGIAIARAVESQKPADERICFDPYARQMVPPWMYLSLFIWQGVTMYLTATAVDATLGFVVQSSAPGSAIVFDYVYKETLENLHQQREISNMRRYRFMTGENLTFGIPAGKVEDYLRELGFQQITDTNSDKLKATYFTGTKANRKITGGYGIAIGSV